MESDKRPRRHVLVPGLMLALLGCAVGPPGGPSGGRPATVAHLTADSPGVEVRRGGQVVPYSARMPLYTGDGVQTGAGMSATIEFTDGNVVYVREGTKLEVGSIRLFFGEIFNLIRSVAGSGSTVYTNDLAAAAETTMFLVRRDATRGTTVTVVEGTVRCTPAESGRWAMVPLRPNQQLTVASTAVARPTIARIDARVSAQWVNTTARRLNRPIVITPRDLNAPVVEPSPVTPVPSRPPPVTQPPSTPVQPTTPAQPMTPAPVRRQPVIQ
jgi:hypothetical protein